MSTDDTRPDTIDPDDELASAFLDGEVDAAERARVETDPALRARAEDLARVRAALGTPPEPSDERREATIAAVLAATVGTTPSATTAPATVTSLASRRRGRTVWAVVAAAAVVLVAVPAALVALSQRTATQKFDAVGTAINGDDSVTVTESSPSAPAAAGPDVANGSGGATRAGGAVTTTAPSMAASADASAETSGAAAPSLGDLGRFDRPEDLAAAIVPEGMAAPSTTAASGGPSSTAVPPTTVAADRSTTTTMAATTQPTCVAAASAVLPSAGVLVRSATATYQGVPVEVLVFGLSDSPDGAEWLVVLDRADCAVLFDQAL